MLFNLFFTYILLKMFFGLKMGYSSVVIKAAEAARRVRNALGEDAVSDEVIKL